jgi:hypothetical protein
MSNSSKVSGFSSTIPLYRTELFDRHPLVDPHSHIWNPVGVRGACMGTTIPCLPCRSYSDDGAAGKGTAVGGGVAVGAGDVAVAAGDVAVGAGDVAVGAGDVAVGCTVAVGGTGVASGVDVDAASPPQPEPNTKRAANGAATRRVGLNNHRRCMILLSEPQAYGYTVQHRTWTASHDHHL